MKAQTPNQPVAAQADIDAPADIQHLEALSRQVVEVMQSLRELLDARAAALEACRSALQEHHGRLLEEQQALVQREAEAC